MSSGSKPNNVVQNKKPEASSSKAKGKVGDWVRHISSSGKEYYYNISSHESHWEKPREWVDYEQRHGPVPYQAQSQPPITTPTKTLVKTASLPNTQHVPSTSSGIAKPNPQLQQPAPSSSQVPTPKAQVQAESSTASTPQPVGPIPLLQIRVSFPQTQQSSSASASYSTASSQNGRGGQVEPLLKERRAPFTTSYSQPSASSTGPSTSNQAYGNSSLSSYNGHGRSTSSYYSQYSSSSNRPRHGNNSMNHMDSNRGRGHQSYTFNSRPQSRQSSSERSRDSRKPEDTQSDDMEISPYDNGGSGTDTKQIGKSSEVASTSGSSPSYSTASARDSRINRNRDRERDRGRGCDKNSYTNKSNGYYSRDHHYRGRDRERVGSPRRGRDRDRNAEWSKDSQRDQDGDRRGRWRDSDRDRERDRENDRESDKHASKYKDNKEDRGERGRNSPKERVSPEKPADEPSGDLATASTTNATSLKKENGVSDLPAGLAIHFREDLIAEVKKTMEDPYEREADKVMSRILESQLKLASVSAELKMARSLVRLTDIQATLKEQKILFIREQIRSLEEDETTYTGGLTLGNTE